MQPLQRFFGRQIGNIPLPAKHKGPRASLPRSQSTYAEDVLQQARMHVGGIRPNVSMQIQKPHFAKQKETEAIIKRDSLTEYYDEAVGFMLSQEAKDNWGAQWKQSESADMRAVLLDWIVDIHLKFKMFPQTLFIMATVLDRYLQVKTVRKEELQLVGATAFFIAAKYEQTYQVPAISELVALSAKSFSKADVLRVEADIIKALDFNLVFNTAYHFLSAFSQLLEYEAKKFFLSQYVLELALLDSKLLRFKPSLLAASSIFLVNKIKKVEVAWPEAIRRVSGYQERQLRPCARELCQLLEAVEGNTSSESLKAKFCLSKFEEVGRIRLQKRKPCRK